MAILALAVVGVVEATSPTHLSMSGGVARLIPEFMLGVRSSLFETVSKVQALLLVLIIGAAVLLHFGIERPMRSWINSRLGSSHRSAKSIAGAKNNERDHGGWYMQRKR
ncbi:hypothetical protein [Cupriavidus sp. a3]|uniref:hypothetical protein n=1 Tax=Cupriavidus sp. a3 TaxID=3242158 RepID=UPI003D9C1ADC